MAEITDKMIAEAEAACKPSGIKSALIIARDTGVNAGSSMLLGGAAGSVLPIIGTDIGAALGTVAGIAIGVRQGIQDANTPDAVCVARNLQERSRDR